MSAIWIINGIPGAGKTTTARALAARFERSVHIEGDKLQGWIVAGDVPPGASPADEEARCKSMSGHRPSRANGLSDQFSA